MGVDTDHLELYERIFAHLGDAAICTVTDEICQGCFHSVTKQEISLLILSEEFVQCRSCNRLLFLG